MKKSFSPANRYILKKILGLLLTVLLLCPLVGCSTKDTTIWIVTEETTWDRMNGQTWVLQAAFEEAHPGVKIRLDILPPDEHERTAYLQQLRTQIMQGRGPDAYLLPTDDHLIIGDGKDTAPPAVEPLFADVALAMENGMFMDMSQWYDADTELGKDGLITAVMDAGVVDGSRYILPLRYDIPVIYAQTQDLEEVDFDLSALEKPLTELMQAAMATGNPLVAAGGIYQGSSMFENWIDYTSGQVRLTEGALTSYMETYRQLLTATEDIGAATRIDLNDYIYGAYDEFPGAASICSAYDVDPSYFIRYPLYIGSLAQLMDYAPVAQYEESEYTILPLRSDDGGTVATVEYYAALGSGCRNPELTYQFLRQFLLKDSQWEYNRPKKMNILIGSPPTKSTQDKSNKTQYPGLIENGWPVRAEGALAPLWDMRRMQFYSALDNSEYKTRLRRIGLTPLEEQWADILNTPIDQVRFPSVVDNMLQTALDSLNDPARAYQPTNVSVHTAAENLIWDMRRHLAEG